jgi:hypothetical protein
VTTSAGTEKWVYTPTAPGTGYTSLTGNLYTRGELWTAIGLLSSAKFDFSDPSPPTWTFGLKGITSALPSDAAAPVITYPLATIAPPLASSIALTLGSFTTNAVVMSGSFDMQRKLDPRVAVSASGAHLGFVAGDRLPIIKVVLEATALQGTPFTAAAGFDPYNLRDKATQIAAALQFGTTQYNRWKINFAQCQVVDMVPQNNNSVATVELTLGAFNSTATAADDVSITFD